MGGLGGEGEGKPMVEIKQINIKNKRKCTWKESEYHQTTYSDSCSYYPNIFYLFVRNPKRNGDFPFK